MLALELETIRSKIQLLEHFQQSKMVTNEPTSENSESKAAHLQTANEHESTNPLKAIFLPKEKQIANEAADKASSSLVQTVASKDNSNPLSPVALGKSKMVNLSPMDIVTQRFVPNGYKKAVEKDLNTNYYVIYEGEHEGIYTNWGIVNSLITGTTTTCKKFKTLEQARQSTARYDQEINTVIFKKPKVKQEDYTRAKPCIKEKRIEQEESYHYEGIEHEDFKTNWIAARKISHEEYKTENLCTDDKTTRSLYIFFENADAQKVYFAYQSGLLKNIYPSPNLQELKYFPHGIIKAIKNFRTKILKASDKPMFISITSSIPDWSQFTKHEPYYFIEIGLAKQKEFQPSKVMEHRYPEYEEIISYRAHGLFLVAQKILNIKENTRAKINYCDTHCIITSWCPTEISKEDIQKITKFEEPFFKNTLDVSAPTKRAYCQKAKILFLEHNCNFCEENNAEKDSTTPTYLSGEEDGDVYLTDFKSCLH